LALATRRTASGRHDDNRAIEMRGMQNFKIRYYYGNGADEEMKLNITTAKSVVENLNEFTVVKTCEKN